MLNSVGLIHAEQICETNYHSTKQRLLQHLSENRKTEIISQM